MAKNDQVSDKKSTNILILDGWTGWQSLNVSVKNFAPVPANQNNLFNNLHLGFKLWNKLYSMSN